MISPIDLCIGLVAVSTLVRATRRPHPVHPTTAILLTLLTGVLLWANLRNSGWQEVWNERAPEGLDPVTKAMFYRGWPLATFMICIICFNRFRLGGLPEAMELLSGMKRQKRQKARPGQGFP